MHIQYLETKNPTQAKNPNLQTGSSKLENRLLDLDAKVHDERATELFAAASMWAYSDLKTFASMMCMRGLYGEFVAVTVKNEMTFVDTTAYLFVSESKKLAMLAFRGMQPMHFGRLMTKACVELMPHGEGSINASFLTANLVVLPVIGSLLVSWSSEGLGLAEGLEAMRDEGCFAHEVASALEDIARMQTEMGQDEPSAKKKASKKKSSKKSSSAGSMEEREQPFDSEQRMALYLCGHGLGGALAGLAGALFHLDPNFMPLRQDLRSIYTFGAPMFADQAFADKLHKQLGERTFRHRYGRDPFPMLPGRMHGAGMWPKRSYYEHFGYEYVNSPRGGWMRMELATPPKMMSFATMMAMWAFGFEKMDPFRWMEMPFSWSDHVPLHYLRTSQLGQASADMFGEEPHSTKTRG